VASVNEMSTTCRLRDLLVLAVLFVPACSSSDGGTDNGGPIVVPDGCQPLLAEPGDASSTGTCLAPYPSDFHRTADPTSQTGFRVRLSGAARPKKPTGEDADVHDVVPVDGASLVPTIVCGLAGDIVHDGLPGVLDDPMKSAGPDSATIIIEASTGTFIPHYTDIVEKKDGTHTPIVLRPFSPLKPKTRYVVAIAGAKLAPTDGSIDPPALAPPPEGFRRLRNGTAQNDPALAALSQRFDADVLSTLSKAGVALDHLQLAWDFTTGSSEQPLADMLAVREATLAWIAANDPQPHVTAMRAGTGNQAKIVTVEMNAPLFLDKRDPGGRLVHDASGKVKQNATTTFTVVVAIPNVVTGGTTPGRALAYGHGFFGNTDELESDGARAISEKLGAVLFATDWWGMSKDDFGVVSDSLTTRPEHVTDFAERVHQAMANWLVALAAIRGPMTKLTELRRPAPSTEALWDPTFVGYFGASQGHILGGTLAGLADFPRAILNVGGGGFTHLMPRSLNFGPFSILLGAVFPDPLLVQSYVAMMQRPLDRIDPISYAPHVLTMPLSPNPPDRRVLLQVGLGDPQVPNVGSFLHARALGIPQAMPAPVSIFGLKQVADADAPLSITVFDFHVDTTGYTEGKPIGPNQVHGGVRVNAKALTQMEAFMKPGGMIIHACDGPCDPE
jgi:hypothetical protein